MSDLISRQAAIDDIWTVSPLARLDRKWVDRWLRQLPSAQPTFDARDTQYNLPIGKDLISRAQAIDAVNRLSLGETDAVRLSMRIGDYLERLQSAQPKMGKWLPADSLYHGAPFYYCSECEEKMLDTVMGKPRWNFCPNCGAKMEVTA